MRYLTYYQATANSTGVQDYVLRLDGDMVVGKDREGAITTYFYPPVTLSEVGSSLWLWNVRKERADALNLYREIEQERLNKAQHALAEAA